MAARDEQASPTLAMALFAGWLIATAIWWALAFVPAGVGPDWVATAQRVCFGTLPNGLPDTWGWMSLTLGPASMLGVLLVVWGRALREGLSRAWSKPVGQAVLTSVAALVLIGVLGVGQRIAVGIQISRTSFEPDRNGALPQDWPMAELAVPDFSLVDAHGKTVTRQDLLGRPFVMTFAFGHCETICPVVVHTARDAVTGFDGDRAPRVVIVTLDPWRDTPSRLMHHLHHWKLPDDAVVLSGEVDAVNGLLDALEVARVRDEATGDLTHAPLIYVGDATGVIRYRFNNPSVRWVRDALDRLSEGMIPAG